MRRVLTRVLGLMSFITPLLAFAQDPPAPGVPQAPPVATPPEAAPSAPQMRSDEVHAVLAPVPGGLTADRVAQRAVGNSHSVRVKLAELDVARVRLEQTQVQFYPVLTLRASYMRLSPVSAGFGDGALVGVLNPGELSVGACPSGVGQCVLDAQGQPAGAAAMSIVMPVDNWALTASLVVPLSDYVLRLSDAKAGSAASRRAAELQVKAERLNVETAARVLFYECLRSRARVVIAEKSLTRTRARLEDARTALELGTITRADLLRLEALSASTEQVLLEARSFHEAAERQLAILLGDEAVRSFPIGEDVSRPAVELPGDLERLTQGALTTRLELRALEQTERSLQYASSAVRSGRWPRLDALADATYANPNQRAFPPAEEWNASWSVGAALSLNVNDVFMSNASSSEYSSSARGIAAQRAMIQDGIRQEVMTYYLARARAKGALEAARRGLVAAEEAYRVATDLYQLGRTTTTDLIEAETDLLGARLAELNTRIEIHVVEARLRHAAGADVAGGPPLRE